MWDLTVLPVSNHICKVHAAAVHQTTWGHCLLFDWQCSHHNCMILLCFEVANMELRRRSCHQGFLILVVLPHTLLFSCQNSLILGGTALISTLIINFFMMLLELPAEMKTSNLRHTNVLRVHLMHLQIPMSDS